MLRIVHVLCTSTVRKSVMLAIDLLEYMNMEIVYTRKSEKYTKMFCTEKIAISFLVLRCIYFLIGKNVPFFLEYSYI